MNSMTTPWTRRKAVETQLDELRLALAQLGPAPADALGRWRHQEEVWRLQREISRLSAGRRREPVPA